MILLPTSYMCQFFCWCKLHFGRFLTCAVKKAIPTWNTYWRKTFILKKNLWWKFKMYGYTIWHIIFDVLSILSNKSNWLNICWKLQHATLGNATRELKTDKKYYHKSKKWSIARHEIYLIMKYVLICNGHGISVILKRELIEKDWTGRHKARKIRLKILKIKYIQRVHRLMHMA